MIKTVALLSLFGLISLSGPSLSAQNAPDLPRNPRMGRNEQRGPFAKLGLSDEQKESIRQIRMRYKGRTAPADKHEMRFEILSVLTEAQRQQFFTMMQERRAERGNRQGQQ